jgi:hypothetical protein
VKVNVAFFPSLTFNENSGEEIHPLKALLQTFLQTFSELQLQTIIYFIRKFPIFSYKINLRISLKSVLFSILSRV